MDLLELKDHIKNNELQNSYIFYGEEYLIKHIYIDMISDKQNRGVEYVDSFMEIKNYLNSKSKLLLPKCYVIYDDVEFMKAENAWTLLDHMSNTNTVIFIYNSLDAKTKFYKYYKQICVKFDRLSENILMKYVTRDYHLNKSNAKDFIERCDFDYGRIHNYGKLILALSEINNIACDTSYEFLLHESQIPLTVQSVEQKIIECVMRDSLTNAYNIYERSKENVRYAYLIIALYNNFKKLLLVQSCQDDNQKDVPKKTGLDAWEVKHISNYVGYFTIRDIVWALKLLKTCENGLKNGTLSESQVVPYFFAQMI